MPTILVCGDRDWKDIEPIRKFLRQYDPKDTTVLHGDTTEVDRLAGIVADVLGMTVRAFPAKWDLDRRAAPLRSREIIVEGKPDLVVAFHPDIERSRNTKNLINQATARSIETIVVR